MNKVLVSMWRDNKIHCVSMTLKELFVLLEIYHLPYQYTFATHTVDVFGEKETLTLKVDHAL